MPDKIIIPLLLIAGAAAIAYGMVMKNNYVFIAGIVIVFAGYRLIRKKLKRSIDEKQSSPTTASGSSTKGPESKDSSERQ